MKNTPKVKIFISYSHFDNKILKPTSDGSPTVLMRRLKALEEDGAEIYLDTDFLRAGDKFDQEIRSRLIQCDILLALISQNFLESKYCTEVEVSSILRRKRRGRKAVIVPFYLSWCEWEEVQWLKDTQALPSPNRPFWSITDSEKRNEALLVLRKHLRERIQLIKKDGLR